VNSMKDDLLSEITYRPIPSGEKRRLQSVLATGNLTIEALAGKEGMAWDNRDAYRKVILADLLWHPALTVREIVACRSIRLQERQAVIDIESIKYRLLEGHVARLMQLVKKHLYMARWFTQEDVGGVHSDLCGEAMVAFSHAVYRFNRFDVQFNTFLTAVVTHWLQHYCESLATVKLSEDLKGLLCLYYSIKTQERYAGREATFQEIVRVIVSNQLQDEGVALTDRNIEEATERQRTRFCDLQQAIRKVRSLSAVRRAVNGDHLTDDLNIVAAPSTDTEAIFNELLERLTPLQRRVVETRLAGRSMRKLAQAEGLTKVQVGRVFQSAKEILGSALA